MKVKDFVSIENYISGKGNGYMLLSKPCTIYAFPLEPLENKKWYISFHVGAKIYSYNVEGVKDREYSNQEFLQEVINIYNAKPWEEEFEGELSFEI